MNSKNKCKDEGYIDNKELPKFISQLTDIQKADLAFTLLSKLSNNVLISIQERLKPLLHKDFISLLPNEISIKILKLLDKDTLKRCESVNKKWYKLCKDNIIWKSLFIAKGWNYNEKLLNYYNVDYRISDNKDNGLGLKFDNHFKNTEYSARNNYSSNRLGIMSPGIQMNKTQSDTSYTPLSNTSNHSSQCNSSRLRSNVIRRAAIQTHNHQSILNNVGSMPNSPTRSGFTSLPMSPSNRSQNVTNINEVVLNDTDNIEGLEDELMNLNLNTSPSLPTTTHIGSNVNRGANSQPLIQVTNIDNSEGERRRPIPLELNNSLQIEDALNTGFMSNASIEEVFSPFLDSPMPNSPFANTGSPAVDRVSKPLRILNDGIKKETDNDKMLKILEQNKEELNKFHGDKINWKRLYFMKDKLECNFKNYKFNTYSLNGHTEGIYCLQLDENYLFSGSRDDSIKQWDLKTGLCINTFVGHQASVLCLQYDSEILVTGSSDSTILVWDIQTANIIYKLEEHMDSVLNLCFDKNYLVSCSKDRSIKIWKRPNTKNGEDNYKLLRTLRGHRVAVNAVQFKDDIIVSASGDRTLKIWSLSSGECLNTLEGHLRGIASLYFNGEIIVTGSSDKTIKIWDPLTGNCIRTLEGHDDLVRTLTVRDNVLVSGSYDKSIRFWDLNTGKLLATIKAHDHRVFKLGVSQTKIVSCSQDPNLMVWDFAYDLNTLFIV